MQEINTPHCSSTRVYISFFRFQKQEERFELKSHEIKVSDPANELRDRGSRGIRPAGLQGILHLCEGHGRRPASSVLPDVDEGAGGEADPL